MAARDFDFLWAPISAAARQLRLVQNEVSHVTFASAEVPEYVQRSIFPGQVGTDERYTRITRILMPIGASAVLWAILLAMS